MHDVLIIGAGPAGLAAAFWCDQLGLDVLLLTSGRDGGQLHPFRRIEITRAYVEGEAFLELRDGTAEAGLDSGHVRSQNSIDRKRGA